MPLLHIGINAKGFLAIGLMARGIFTFGLLSIGVLSFGMLSIGLLAFGLFFGVNTLVEAKELLQRRMKAFVADSKAFQAYMQQTNDANRYKKICKRAILFPITLLKALGEK